MNENRAQQPQSTAAEILELTDQMLNLTDQMNEIVDRMLNLSIPTEPENRDTDEEWTPERFGALVTGSLEERYEDQNRGGELYRLGAELKNLIQEQGWELRHEFSVKHIFFFFGDRRLFGINLFSSRPRLTFCQVTEEDVRSIVPEYNFTPYSQYTQLVCQRGPTVEDLQPLYEFIYYNNSSES